VRRPGLEPGAISLEGNRAVQLRQRRLYAAQRCLCAGERCLCAAQVRLRAAQRSRTPSPSGKSRVPGLSGASGVGRAGIEPATDSRCIRSALSPLSYRPVRPRGVEPRGTCLSGRPLHRLGRGGQRMRSESNAQGRAAHPDSGRAPSPVGLRIQERIAEVLPPRPLQVPPGFEPGAAPRRLHDPRRRTVDTIHNACAPIRFPDEASTLAGSSSMAESGRLERHAPGRALVSSEAGHPGPFTLHVLPEAEARVELA
jgi:hypothetical protein